MRFCNPNVIQIRRAFFTTPLTVSKQSSRVSTFKTKDFLKPLLVRSWMINSDGALQKLIQATIKQKDLSFNARIYISYQRCKISRYRNRSSISDPINQPIFFLILMSRQCSQEYLHLFLWFDVFEARQSTQRESTAQEARLWF